VMKRFDTPEECLETCQLGAPGLFADEERNEKVVELLRGRYGEEAFELEWKGVAVTATKGE
jgi:hypothetical protein